MGKGKKSRNKQGNNQSAKGQGGNQGNMPADQM